MARIDLDAARAARAEKQEQHSIVFGGEEFALPPEAPFEFAFKLIESDFRGALRELLGEQTDAFFSHHPTMADITELVDGAGRMYGFDGSGESEASEGSSSNGSNPSRPTSDASTSST